MKPDWKPIDEPPKSEHVDVRCTLFGAYNSGHYEGEAVLIYAQRVRDHMEKIDNWEVDGDAVAVLHHNVTFTHWDFEPEWPEVPVVEDDTWTSINNPPKAQVITDGEDLTQYLIIWRPKGCRPELTLAQYVKDTDESVEHFYNDGVIEDVLLWKHPPSIAKGIESLNEMCIECKKEKKKLGDVLCQTCIDDMPF